MKTTIENCITLLITAALILGLYKMGAGGWSFWGLVLLMNINYYPRAK